LPGVRLAAVAGRSPERTAVLAEKYGARADRGIAELLDRGGVDAVILCTPHPQHPEQGIAAARAGLHVLVEKPMALTAADARAMVEAANASGVVLSMVSQRRWYESCRRVKDAIEGGRIGVPALATMELFGWRGPEYYAMDDWRGTSAGEGGGVLVNQAVHQIDLLRWFMGPAEAIDAWTSNVNHPEIDVEDSAVAIIRFANGALATVIASNSQKPGLYGRIHIHGQNGYSVGVETDSGSMFVAGVTPPSLGRNDLWTIPGEEDLPERWLAEDRAMAEHVDLETHYHELQLHDFIDAIRDGRPAAVTGEDGLATAELIDGIYTAMRTGGRVTLGST
jgi:predicted dehydrogenase